MKTLYTASSDGQWGGWEAKLRDDDSLVVEYDSRIQGTRTGSRYRFEGTGLLGAIQADEELDPETAIDEYIARADISYAKCLNRGCEVQ